MKAVQNHFQTAKKDFQLLKKNKEIPPQMETKLEYLLCRLQKRQIQSFLLDTLPEYQKSSLDQLNFQTGTSLFCNIVNCLSGKEVVLYFRDEKSYLRKDQLFAMWKQCYITCDSNNIIIRKKINQKPYYVFEIINLRISKNFKLYKKKHVFGACYKKQKNYLIGFDLQSSCARVHQLLRGLIRQKVNKSQSKQPDESVSEISISRVLQNPKQIEQSNTKQQQVEYEDAQEEKEEEVDENTDRGVVIQFIRQEEINGDNMFKLIKTQQNLRQMVNKNYPNKLKTELILPKPKTASNVFDYYVKTSEWNPQVEESTIKTKLSDNSYLIQIRVKKYSYISWPRQTVLLVTGLTYKNNYFLVLRSTGEQCNYSDTVKMEWNQIVEVCQSQDKILVSFSTQLDFKGYSSLQDSQRMGLKVIDNLKLFTKFYEAKQISSKIPKLFNLIIQQKKPKIKQRSIMKKPVSLDLKLEQSIAIQNSPAASQKKVRKLSNNSQFEVPDDESKQQVSVTDQPDKKIITQASKPENDPADFTIYKMKNGQSEVSHQLVELIKQRAFQKYYLKQKFDMDPHVQLNRFEHVAEGPNHYILQNGNWKINEEQDLIFINQKLMQLQKDVIKMIIKQLGSNIMSGKSVMNMSLPVQIFDHRSILQRLGIGFGYAPKFLLPASETEDLIEQAKNVALFIMGIGPLHLCLQKPFNPILGETFQCRIGGIPLYFQQVSHHPPISAVLMKTQNFILHGSFHSHAQMGLNRVVGRNLSPLFIDFPKTSTYYEVKLPQMEISGLLHGQKKYRGQGKGFIYQKTNNLFVQWSIGKDKKKVYQAEGKVKASDLNGGIYTVTPAFGKKFQQCENKQKFDGLKPEDVIQTHVKITGHWCFNINFNGKQVKSISNPLPNKLEYPELALPSDSNYRLDILQKRRENLKASNEQKQILENIQRRDRKLRQGKIKLK